MEVLQMEIHYLIYSAIIYLMLYPYKKIIKNMIKENLLHLVHYVK